LHDWIRNLNSGNFTLRVQATAELKKRLEAALPLLEADLARGPSAETLRRLESLIAELPNREREQLRRVTAQPVLAYIATQMKGA
jgi:hypothetical protein